MKKHASIEERVWSWWCNFIEDCIESYKYLKCEAFILLKSKCLFLVKIIDSDKKPSALSRLKMILTQLIKYDKCDLFFCAFSQICKCALDTKNQRRSAWTTPFLSA